MGKDNDGKAVVRAVENGRTSAWNQARLARQLFSGRFRAGQCVPVHRIATELGIDKDSAWKALKEFHALGLITLDKNSWIAVNGPDLKGIRDAYNVRAALEEIAGRAAASTLQGNVTSLLEDVGGMRAALQDGDIDACVEHDIQFHRRILEASGNQMLIRVWDTLHIDLLMRAMIARIIEHMREVVESHQPIVDALEKGRGRQAGVLLRNHVETFSEYIRHAKSESGFHRAMQTELEGAKDVQRAFFPPPSLAIPCLSCETFYQPAQEIGGDYYDLLSLQGERWGIAIGDVSGKGIGAALVMASLQASLRAQALRPHSDLSALIGDVNQLVHGSSPTHFFASLFYAEYQPATRTLRYVNAGHNAPMVVRPGEGRCEIIRLKPESMPVGIASDAQFKTATFRLEPGDLLIAYTDGITEAQNPQGDLWGEERLERLLSAHNGDTPQEIIEEIVDAVFGFAGGQSQRDDMTLVVMKLEDGCQGGGPAPARLRKLTKLVQEKIENSLAHEEMAEFAGLTRIEQRRIAQ